MESLSQPAGKEKFFRRVNLRQAFLNFILIVAGACLLLWTPLHNGYPLIYSDSGTYIFSGALSYAPSDRPIGYGLFIRYLNPISRTPCSVVGAKSWESAREAWAQFWMARSSDHIAYLAKEFNAARAIRRVDPHERAQFLNSIEQAGKPVPISLMPLSEQVMLGIFLGAAVILFGMSIARKEYNLAALLGVTLILLTVNAIFVGALNGAAGRYQMRLAWLLAYCTYLCAAVFIARRRQRACGASNLLSVC